LHVLGLDPLQGAAQRRAVGGVPRQYFIAEREAIGRHDQRDHQLDAVASLVAAVAIAALVIVIVGLRGLKISAGQVIQQDLETSAKQVLPAPAQVIEQRCLVLQ